MENVTIQYDKFELTLPLDVVDSCHHMGECQFDCENSLELPEVRAQFERIGNDLIKEQLLEYGAWSVDELSDFNENCIKMLWIASGDYQDQKGVIEEL